MSRTPAVRSWFAWLVIFGSTSAVGGAVAAPPQAVSPGEAHRFPGSAVACPTFSWAGTPGARGHDLVVYEVLDETGAHIGSRPAFTVRLPGQASSWTPSAERCLAPGRYAWAVRASAPDGGEAWSEPLLFQVSGVPSEAELQAALEVVRRYLDARGATPGAGSPIADTDRASRSASIRAAGTGNGAIDREAERGVGERVASRGVPGEPAIVLGGAPLARLAASTFERDSAAAVTFDFANPGAGTMTLRVDGVDVVTTATDQDTTYSAGNQLQLSGTTFDVLEGSASGLDADTLDGLDATAFVAAGSDHWVDETGDAMTGALAIDVAAGSALTTAAGDDIDLGGALLLGGTLFLHGDGTDNTALGADALAAGTGSGNTALGSRALQSNTTGERNVAVGHDALQANTSGHRNVAVGYGALQANDTGLRNTALGHVALLNNTGGVRNVAVGSLALVDNTTGHRNIAVGVSALYANTTGEGNVAVGESALGYNVGGHDNAAVGRYALLYNSSGNRNVAIGHRSSFANVAGERNVAVGNAALYSNTVGSRNIAVGSGAGSSTAGSDNIAIGNSGGAENGAIRIGTAGTHTSAFLAGVHGTTPGGGSVQAVVVDANGQLGSAPGGSGSGIDADLLDGIDSTGFLAAGTDLWLDTAGDTMSGTLGMGGNALAAVGDVALNDASEVTKNAARFLWDDAALASLSLGRSALGSNTTGSGNVGLGPNALQFNTVGEANVAVGTSALAGNLGGSRNSAIGNGTLQYGMNASDNTAVGFHALRSNDSGVDNTAVGAFALTGSTTGSSNVAFGRSAALANTEGRWNAAVGTYALSSNTTGIYNTAVGGRALRVNTTGNQNTAVGEEALVNSDGAHNNVAVGQAAMLANTSGNDNIALGSRALYSNTGGSGNIAIGRDAGFDVTGSLNVSIAHTGLAGESGAIRIGTPGNHTSAFLAGVHGVAPGGANLQSVVVDASGQLGSVAGGGGSGIDADLLDGIDSTGFMSAGADLWVDTTGDTMSGTLDLDPPAGLALTTADPIDLAGDVFRSGSLFLHTNGGGATALGLNALATNAGVNNTAVGENALAVNDTGISNTAVGLGALALNAAGDRNVAVGTGALASNTTASDNTALGHGALAGNTSGLANTAVGRDAMVANTTGNYNVAVGAWALNANEDGANNTAVGYRALRAATTSSGNTALGAGTLEINVSGSYNTAVGAGALASSTTASTNTAVGHQALTAATEGNNTAVGERALLSNSTGYENVAVGSQALRDNTTGQRNIALGHRAGYAITGNDNIAIGHVGYGSGDGRIHIGSAGTHTVTVIAGIHSVAPGGPTPLPVVIDAAGQLGTTAGGGGSGLDADLLDGLDSTAFVLDAGDSISGNLAVGGGLDVTGANLTVGGANFTVDPGSGNTNIAGTLDVDGNAAFDSQVDLRGATNVGDSPGDSMTVVGTFQLQPRSAAPTCGSAADAGIVYYDSDDGTFCFCEGAAGYRALDGAGACS